MMPNNKTKRAVSKPAGRKGQSNVDQSQSDQRGSKLLQARREQLRSSSMPTVVESVSKVEENGKSRPRSAENNVDSRDENVKFKTLLHFMMAGEWTGALGRMSNLDEKSPELGQANVNIDCSFLNNAERGLSMSMMYIKRILLSIVLEGGNLN